MFETILEKVLLSNLGQFLQGLDKNNLKIGVWSGNVVIQNISLKPDVVNMLELPVQIKFSFIGKLNVKVPWASLGSKPVEVDLEDVYLILAPTPNSEWKPVDFNSVNKRMEIMETFIKEYLNKIAEKQKSLSQNKSIKDKDNDQGMVAKMTERIIDNIQVIIRNIHARFEGSSQGKIYALGITLEEILIYTTNQKWEREFIDRTNNKNKLLPMNKMLSLKKLGIYWNPSIPVELSDLAKDKIINTLRNVVKGTTHVDFIINITATAYLTMKNPKNPQTAAHPLFDLMLAFDPIDIQLKKLQLQQIINLLEFFMAYKRFILVSMQERLAKIKQIPPEEQLKNIELFKVLFTKLMKNEKKDEFTGEEKLRICLGNEQEVSKFRELLLTISDDSLAICIKDVIKDIEKDNKLKALEAEEAKKQRSSWSFFGSSSNSSKSKDNKADQADELMQLQQYINEVFHDVDDTSINSSSDTYQIQFRLSFNLKGGNVFLNDLKSNGNEEGINFNYEGLESIVEINNRGNAISLSLKTISLALKTKYIGTNSYVMNPIIQRDDYLLDEKSSTSLLWFEFAVNPKGRPEGTYIQLISQALEIVYRPQAIERLNSFFNIETEDELLLSQAKETLENAQDKAKNAANDAIKAQENTKKSISIMIAGPTVILPFKTNGDMLSECWIINLGNLKVESKDMNIDDIKIYEIYEIILRDTKFQYFPSQLLYMSVYKSIKQKYDLSLLNKEEHEEASKIFDIIENISIALNIKLKQDNNLTHLDDDNTTTAKPKYNIALLPKIDISIAITPIHIWLNPYTLKNLLNTPNILYGENAIIQDLIETDRTKLLNGCIKMGVMHIKEKKFNGEYEWHKYFVIFKGGYLYFFKKQQDQRSYVTHYIKNAKLYEITNDAEKPNCFIIESRYTRVILGFDEEKAKNEWLKIISLKITEYSSIRTDTLQKNIIKENKIKPIERPTEPKKWNEFNIKIEAEMKAIMLSLLDQNNKTIIEIEKKAFQIRMNQKIGIIALTARLGGIEIRDYIYEYKNPNLYGLMISRPNRQNNHDKEMVKNPEENVNNTELIEINLLQIEREHPDYYKRNTDLMLEIKFGYLFFNCKPDIINTLISYILDPLKEIATKKQNEQQQGSDMTNIIQSASKSRISIINEDNEIPEEIFKKNIDVKHIIVDLKISLKELTMRFIHQQTHILISEISLNELKSQIIMQQCCIDVTAKLNNLQVWDMTNYPNTIDSNLEWEKIVPYEILGVGIGNQSLLELSFRSLDPQSGYGNREKRIFSHAKINMSSIRINFLKQPILRIIDFLTNQLIKIVEGIPESKQNDSSMVDQSIIASIKAENCEKAIYKLIYPEFLDMDISIVSPIITLKPQLTSEEYIEISLGDMKVHNTQVKNQDRITNGDKYLDHVWSEIIFIELNHMGIHKVSKNQRYEMSQDFNFKLEFERLLFLEEYKLLYIGKQTNEDKILQIDNYNLIKGDMAPMIITLSKSDYILFMKGLNYNVNYDDNMDHMFICDNVDKQSYKNTHTTSKLKLNLCLQNISLLIVDPLRELPIPIAMINLHLLKINVNIDQDDHMKIYMSARDINSSYFESEDNNNIQSVYERRMIGIIDKITKYDYNNEILNNVVENIRLFIQKYIKQENDELLAQYENEHRLILELEKSANNGPIILKTILQDFKIYLAINPLLKLADFTHLDSSVMPPPSISSTKKALKHTKTNLFDVIHEKTSDAQSIGQMTINAMIKNIILTIPSASANKNIDINSQVLALKGDISFVMASYDMEMLDEVINEYKDKTYKNPRELMDQMNEINRMNITLKDVEIFICNLKELLNLENFKYVRKRNMIMPFSLIFTRKIHNVLNNQKTKNVIVMNNDLNIQSLVMKLSYHDYVLLYNSLQYQLEQLNLYMNTHQIASNNQFSDSISSLDESKSSKSSIINDSILTIEEKKEGNDELQYDDEEINNSEGLVANLNGLQICIINDAEETFIPVLEFTIETMTANLLKYKTTMEATGTFSISSNFFNPKPSRWEPIIEKFGMIYEFNSSQISPKINLKAITDNESQDYGLNINISDQMLEVINYTIQTWKLDFESKRIDKKSNLATRKQKEEQEEVIDYVSPYIIYNETGYSIDIQADLQNQYDSFIKLKEKTPQLYKIPYGGKISYLLENERDKVYVHGLKDNFMSNRIKVNINHPQCNLNMLNRVNIDKVKTSLYKIQGKDQNNKPYGGESSIICDLQVINSKKILMISSSILIKNHTKSQIQIYLDNNANSSNLILQPNEYRGIPFDFVNGSIAFKIFELPNQILIKKTISEYLQSSKGNAIDTKCGEHYLAIKASQNDMNIAHYTLNILPPFSIKNCFPLPFSYQLSYASIEDNKVRHIKTQEIIDETKIPRGANISIRIKLQNFAWSKWVIIYSSDPKLISSHVTLVDYISNQVKSYVHIQESSTGAKTFYFYTKACIINETPYDLYFYANENQDKKTPHLLAGQKQLNPNEVVVYKKICLADEMILLSSSLYPDGKDLSKSIGIGSIGSTALELPISSTNGLMELGVYIETHSCDKNLFVYTKIITISPRYLIINRTKNLILAKRAYSENIGINGGIELLQEVRTPFLWNDWKPNSKHTISIKIIEKHRNNIDYWNWSGGFYIDTVGSNHILITSIDQKEYKYIRVIVNLSNEKLFIIIEEEDPSSTSLKIQNSFNDMNIYISQITKKDQSLLKIPPNTTIPYAWVYPDEDRNILCRFHKENSFIKNVNIKYPFDELNQIKQYNIITENNHKDRDIYAIVKAEGSSRVLKFNPENIGIKDKYIMKKEEEMKVITNMHLELSISYLRFSFIANIKPKDKIQRKEIIHASFKCLDLAIDNTSIYKSSQLRIKYFNIDNNSSYKTIFPILITPSKPKDLLMPIRKSYFLDMLIVQKIGSKDMLWFPTIKFLLAETTIQIDGVFLDVLLMITKQINNLLNDTKDAEKDLTISELVFIESPTTLKLADKDFFNSKFQWKSQIISDLGHYIFIEELVIQPLFFNLTFQLSKGKSTQVNTAFIINLLKNTLGNIIANLDNAPIRLSGISMMNIYDTKDSVITVLVNKYKEEGKLALFKILGSIDLIGNPVALFGNISTGVKDLFEKPTDGFFQGPLEGTKGLALGAGSLLKNTVSGTFNSIGKITGSVASGFSSLTFDEDFLERRARAKLKRPKHVGDGLIQGATSLATGVFDGVTGVFLKPIEGAKKGGFAGLMKGIGQGVTGIVTKPIVGVLDAASKTSEGVKNTATLLDERPNECRSRYPRAFYGKDKYYKVYNEQDAELMNYFNTNKDPTYNDYPLLTAIDVFPNEKEKDLWNIFALGSDSILLWNVKKKKVSWEIELDNIEKIELNNTGIEIIAKRKTSKIKDIKVMLANYDEEINTLIKKKLIEVKNTYEREI